jgi:hypothetical protein
MDGGGDGAMLEMLMEGFLIPVRPPAIVQKRVQSVYEFNR